MSLDEGREVKFWVGKHKLEDHNYWISRGYPCPYCKAGSVPVPKDELKEGA